VYLGNIYPPSIDEYSLSQSKVRVDNCVTYLKILRRFPLTIPGSNSTNGLTAMTFVRISDNVDGGVFWVGSSVDGAIRVYQLPLSNPSNSTATLLGKLVRVLLLNCCRCLLSSARCDEHYVVGLSCSV
jgi:hypothetical protein